MLFIATLAKARLRTTKTRYNRIAAAFHFTMIGDQLKVFKVVTLWTPLFADLQHHTVDALAFFVGKLSTMLWAELVAQVEAFQDIVKLHEGLDRLPVQKA